MLDISLQKKKKKRGTYEKKTKIKSVNLIVSETH